MCFGGVGVHVGAVGRYCSRPGFAGGWGAVCGCAGAQGVAVCLLRVAARVCCEGEGMANAVLYVRQLLRHGM